LIAPADLDAVRDRKPGRPATKAGAAPPASAPEPKKGVGPRKPTPDAATKPVPKTARGRSKGTPKP
jgi:hypothetical protein